MTNWLINEGPKWIFMFVYYLINMALFVYHFMYYLRMPEYFYLNKLIGYGLPFARGAAACLNLNCALILIPVCRNLISYIRGSTRRCCKRNILRLMDKNITFHKVVGYMICVNTAIHAGAHFFNVENFTMVYQLTSNDTELLSALTSLPTSINGTWVNPVRTPNTDPTLEAVKLLPGVTGVLATLALIIMVSSSTLLIRHSYFEIFWYTHHLFVIFYIAIIVHGMQGVVRSQSNIDVHDPTTCYLKYKEWAPGAECDVPQFSNSGPKTWQWVILPVIIYFIERCIRFWRSLQTIEVLKIIDHPSNVIELQLRKAGFKMESGQYIFLKCPSISHLEWHPFTLTSAPQEDSFSVHIRIVGDWTKALAKALKSQGAEDERIWKMPRLAVDGPFGTATEDVFQYQVDVFVGAGIGVTPFASVLKNIWYKYQENNVEMKLRKVYFYWICPDTGAFEWFADLLTELEQQMEDQGLHNFLSCQIYLTRGWNSNQARNIALHADDAQDVVTGLKHKTNFGRPNWDSVFSGLSDKHPSTSVGVFFCGPKVLSTTLHKMCNQYTSLDENGTRFFYNKENF
ncbi:NADPH oxidase 2-like [Tubulanus polymorphus]|uniref:NADPH oxidase 2-like n=1 Tax=Tubulanus polymorphus TaxID=672921 RepID=UPI003DA5EB2F